MLKRSKVEKLKWNGNYNARNHRRLWLGSLKLEDVYHSENEPVRTSNATKCELN